LPDTENHTKGTIFNYFTNIISLLHLEKPVTNTFETPFENITWEAYLNVRE
jgi:hypothetical protein